MGGRHPCLLAVYEESYPRVWGVLTKAPKPYLYDHVVIKSTPRPNKYLTEEPFPGSGHDRS